ncbi:MAG TPA: hypothetical protein VGK67_04575 [Myxococcales bacterium]|jgi:hypothetical protein
MAPQVDPKRPRLTVEFVLALLSLWLILSVVYLGLCSIGGSALEWSVFPLIAVILLPIGAARFRGLTGREKIQLTTRSLTGPKGFIADVSASVDKSDEEPEPGRRQS